MKIQKIYISFQKYIFYTENVCVTNEIYKSFLNIYSFCKKRFFFDHKKYIS